MLCIHWCLGWLALFAAASCAGAAMKPADQAAMDALFTNANLLHLKLEIPQSSVDSLRRDARKYAPITIREGNITYTNVAAHLKGSAGSFRGFDDKAGFSLNFSYFNPGQKFHGVRKIHLNNSAQDPTYLSEFTCGYLFRKAGVPATRVTHAIIEINGRKMGLYVLKEAFEREFLGQYFKNTDGNVYGQSGGGDINQSIDRMEGQGPLTHADLKALAAAASERDNVKRLAALDKTLDLDRFISFMALEVMLCHWDGYTFACHNYRVYHDPDSDHIIFFPHDLDQMMHDPNVDIMSAGCGMVAQAILQIPAARDRYQDRFGVIFTNFFVPAVLNDRIDRLVEQLKPKLAEHNKSWGDEFANRAAELKSRITRRAAALEKQLAKLRPRTALQPGQELNKLGEWARHSESGGPNLDLIRDKDGKPTLWIRAGGKSVGSWRARLNLPPGNYRFEGRACAAGIQKIEEPERGVGAGLRVAGTKKVRTNKLVGDSGWVTLACEFEIGQQDNPETELVCELRAAKGEVWFERDSLKVVRVK